MQTQGSGSRVLLVGISESGFPLKKAYTELKSLNNWHAKHKNQINSMQKI